MLKIPTFRLKLHPSSEGSDKKFYNERVVYKKNANFELMMSCPLKLNSNTHGEMNIIVPIERILASF